MRDDAKLVFRLKAQMRHFASGLCQGLTAAASRAVSEVLYGLCKSGDIKLTNIGRGLKGQTKLENVVERISRNLSKKDISKSLNRGLVAGTSRRIGQETLLIVDESDIQKRYARSMEHLGRVRDGSSGKIGNGYWNLNIVATDVGSRDVLPLWGELYSISCPRCGGENAVITNAFREVSGQLGGRGIWVMDRGFDRGHVFKELLGLNQRFVVRLVGNRRLRWRRGVDSARDIAVGMRFRAEIVKRRNGRERLEKIAFGSVLVRLPGVKDWFRLVKVRFERGETLLLLTNVEIEPTLKDVLWVVKAYIARWRVEETIRFIKQSYNLEDIRLRSYNGLRNMMALVMACGSFVSLTLGLRVRLQILTRKLLDASQRVQNIIKDFKYYAIADGLKEVLSSAAKPWREPKPPPSPQMTICFAPTQGGRLM
jgi:hypothetical protein